MQQPSQSYGNVNKAVLALALAGLALPFFAPLVGRLLPAYSSCASLAWFNTPCPLCGLTRGVAAILHGELTAATRLNVLSLPVFVLLLIETGYRSAMLGPYRAVPWQPRAVRWDARVHALLAIAYLAYAAWFMLAR